MDLSTYGLPVLLLARITGVHIDTARRWKRSGKFPRQFAPLIKLITDGDLGILDQTWSGFRLRDGRIWTPEGEPIRPGDLRAVPYRLQHIAALERELADARKAEALAKMSPALLTKRSPPVPAGTSYSCERVRALSS